MTTTQEMASRVLKDSQVFTLRKDDGAVAGLRWWMPRIFRVFTNNLLTVDEPDHTRLRGIVDEAFRRRAVLDMEPRIRAIADELAGDLFARGSPADLVTQYARMLPLSVICELLGLPLTDRPKFMAWAGRATSVASALGLLRVVPSFAAMKRYLERHLEYARKVGGECLIAELVRVEKEGAPSSHGHRGEPRSHHRAGGAVRPAVDVCFSEPSDGRCARVLRRRSCRSLPARGKGLDVK
jgi:cytochrome P450 PksS